MVKITVDGKIYEVNPGRNLLETCLSLGINIPHFCYHPALGSVGACRLCAVKKFKDKDDTLGRIVMSCMEPVADGLIVSVDDHDAKTFRASVIESLMSNHPHDCPVCDEGGECHLQDMTIMTGHTYRRFDFPKRTYNNQDLGPFINHEMNRCIQCYRCVRFYRDYAGGRDLNVFASRNHVYFGRHKDGTLENEFSGNLVEVCPTGVFTDKTLKNHFTRKWDLTNSPSVCVHCSVGCNTIVSERYGSARRIMSRYNGAVNGYFICDRGRFGYEFVNNEKRILSVGFLSGSAGEKEVLEDDKISALLEKAIGESTRFIGIGSPRASIESNYALMSLSGKDNFYHGISKGEFRLTSIVSDYLQNSGVKTPSLKEIEKADAILILGEDLVNTAPMIALAVRQAARNIPNREAEKNHIPLWNDIPVRELGQNTHTPLFIVSPFDDSLDDIATESFRSSLKDIGDLGNVIIKDDNEADSDLRDLAGRIFTTLKDASNPLIISGISCCDESVINSAMNIATHLRSKGSDVMLSLVLPECNSMGLSLFPGKSFEDIADNEIDTLVVLENDLYRRADKKVVDQLFKKSRKVIVLDQIVNQTSEKSHLLLPVSTFAESEGTHVNNEGRAQRYYKALQNKNQVKESWRWLGDFLAIKNKKNPWENLDDLILHMSDALPVFLKVHEYLPGSDFRMLNTKIPRQTMRFSGRTAMYANVEVSESGPPNDPDSPLSFSMEGQQEQPPSSLIPFYWIPGWNSVQALYGYTKEPNESLKGGDPGIRLFETAENVVNRSRNVRTEEREIKPDEILIVPLYQIFGSDEMSSYSKSVASRIEKPYLMMNKDDAEKLRIKDGDIILLEVSDNSLNVEIKTGRGVRAGMAGLPVNVYGLPYVSLPAAGKIKKV